MIPKLLPGALALLAGCAPVPVVISGAETRGQTDSPRVAPAAVTPMKDGGARLELLSSEGVLMAGMLVRQQQPVYARIAATGQPFAGGAIELAGDVSGGELVMSCRFRLLNPVRGMDGGGTGRCTGTGRQVDFQF